MTPSEQREFDRLGLLYETRGFFSLDSDEDSALAAEYKRLQAIHDAENPARAARLDAAARQQAAIIRNSFPAIARDQGRAEFIARRAAGRI